jgi:hypothetical protein
MANANGWSDLDHYGNIFKPESFVVMPNQKVKLVTMQQPQPSPTEGIGIGRSGIFDGANHACA